MKTDQSLSPAQLIQKNLQQELPSKNPSTHIKGRLGEELATDFLLKEGYEIIKKNLRLRGKEVDIVARVGDILCFVEVKAWRGIHMSELSRSVDRRKQSGIIKVAEAFIHLHPAFQNLSVRFDVIFIETQEKMVHHFCNAFDASS